MAAAGGLPQGHWNNRIFHFTLSPFIFVYFPLDDERKYGVSEESNEENILTEGVQQKCKKLHIYCVLFS
jgi:hypothetical protein